MQIEFQSTHPRGVRPIQNKGDKTQIRISIHAPTRGATRYRGGYYRSTFDFNPRTHEGCDDFARLCVAPISNFNPRTHEGCDDITDFLLILREISIHAPTRGATSAIPLTPSVSIRFQSTHPRGVRLIRPSFARHSVAFQSTHPRGVRRVLELHIDEPREISIHAPTRGATTASEHGRHRCSHFNPRTHEGCDAEKKWLRETSYTFQSTHPRGVRLILSLLYYLSITISIHAPTRGAT